MRLALGDAEFDVTHRALVMGILNRTPDSFYDAGRYYDFDAFLAKAAAHVADGADFLDVGGVKAGPGEPVGEDEELERVVPAVEALVARFDLPVSVDTWRSSVLDAALAAGASVGNDISGFADPDYLPVAARHGASVVATHIRLAPRVPDPAPEYPEGVVEAVVRFCAERAALGGGGRHPPRTDHGRRRPRPREDRAHVARAAPGVRPAGRARLPGVPVGLQQALPRRGARPAGRRATAGLGRRPRPGHRPRLPGAAGPRRARQPAGGRRDGRHPGGEGLRPERCVAELHLIHGSDEALVGQAATELVRRLVGVGRSVPDGGRPDARRGGRHRRSRGGRGADPAVPDRHARRRGAGRRAPRRRRRGGTAGLPGAPRCRRPTWC